jgi:CoA:oxalate CoA-transferase
MPSAKPLAGLRVVDFSMAYAGPICGRMMSDCGADVIKIEPTRFSDGVRSNPRIFTHFNAGKLGVQIDLSDPEGQQLAHELIDSADVVIENYRPGIMTKFGLDYASIKPRHPGLVYCSISGFGQTGPDAQRAAYAPIAHAASGYDVAHMGAQIHANTQAQTRPQASGIMIADMLTGAYAYGAIQTALLGRVTSGLGDHIDVTMLESMMTLIPAHQQAAQVVDPPQMGGFLPITASDGYIMACVVSDKNFDGLCAALARPDLHDDERFGRTSRIPNVRYLVGEIEQWSATRTVAECEAHFHPAHATTAPQTYLMNRNCNIAALSLRIQTKQVNTLCKTYRSNSPRWTTRRPAMRRCLANIRMRYSQTWVSIRRLLTPFAIVGL